MGLDIRFIEGKRGCGMILCSLDLAERLARSKGIKSIQVFKIGSFKFYDKEEFLRDRTKATGGKV